MLKNKSIELKFFYYFNDISHISVAAVAKVAKHANIEPQSSVENSTCGEKRSQ